MNVVFTPTAWQQYTDWHMCSKIDGDFTKFSS